MWEKYFCVSKSFDLTLSSKNFVQKVKKLSEKHKKVLKLSEKSKESFKKCRFSENFHEFLNFYELFGFTTFFLQYFQKFSHNKAMFFRKFHYNTWLYEIFWKYKLENFYRRYQNPFLELKVPETVVFRT